MSVQFSGGEPTLSPYFLDAVAYARKVGYTSVQAATNGIEFAKSKEFCKAAADAGLRYAYLQFDGIGNAANSHRKVGNSFDVKLQAIHNLHEAGVDIVPVTCIINGINNEQVGRIIEFALREPEEDQLPFVPAGFVYGPRRGCFGRASHGAALYAVAPGARCEEPDGPGRADAGLVPDFVHVDVLGLGGPGAWAGSRLGSAELRMPPELRHLDGADDRQGNQGSGSGDGVHQRGPAGEGHCARERRGARQDADHHWRGAGVDAELHAAECADALQDQGPADEVRQELRRERARATARFRPTGRWTISRSAARTAGTSCSSRACGSRTCSTTTSGARNSASFRMRRRKARSASARTTRAWAGATLSRRCT